MKLRQFRLSQVSTLNPTLDYRASDKLRLSGSVDSYCTVLWMQR